MSRQWVLLLDYDGTLVPIVERPELAKPDSELVTLLHDLSRLSGVEVHLVSGRPREVMESWFGALRIGLHAEHGLWSRWPGNAWYANMPLDPVASERWKSRVREYLTGLQRRFPGSWVEEKSHALAWHYRALSDDVAASCAAEAERGLDPVIQGAPVTLLRGKRILEVRAAGVSKARAVERVLSRLDVGSLCADSFASRCRILAAGDDQTDEELFAALPAGTVTIHIGAGPSIARCRLESPEALRQLLRQGIELEAQKVVSPDRIL